MRKTTRKDKRRRPDETFQAGPLAFARFGKFIVAKNLASPEEMRSINQRLAASYDSVTANIHETATAIGNIVARYDPLQLLKRAYWINATRSMRLESEVEMDSSHVNALRMLDYVQAVVVSHPPHPEGYLEPSDAVWKELSEKVEDLFKTFNHSYPLAARAKRKLEDPQHYNEDLEEFLFKAQIYWANIRGDRYVNHDAVHFEDILAPHDDVLKDLFGVSVREIIVGYEKLQNSLLRGPFEAFAKMQEIHATAWPRVEENLKGDESDEVISKMVHAEIEKLGLREAVQTSIEQGFGLGLFDVAKVTGLPAPLLNELSYRPGEENSFFSGSHRGWPSKVWPNWVRPFLMIDGVTYCFDLYSLKDRLYRVIQRLVCRKRPEYQETWNARQKAVSEWLPFKIFSRLLPGGTIHQSLYYRFKPQGEVEAKWYESDGIYIYDDALIAVEVKGGAFTLAPPSTNLENYISSLNELITRPAKQSSRLLDYLGSAQEVAFFDKNHREILRLRANAYRLRVACAVTLDAFTELAARAGHLKAIGIDIGHEPIWNISIDDLRVASASSKSDASSRRMLARETCPRAGCGKSARPVR